MINVVIFIEWRIRLITKFVSVWLLLVFLLGLGTMQVSLAMTATQCSNSIDDDQNGLADLLDPKCTSEIDDDEFTFATGIPGDNTNSPSLLDCFFDGDSSTSEGCEIHACCMIDGPCPQEYLPFDPNQCDVSAECVAQCEPLVRKECDCFGCCEICDAGQPGCFEVFIHPVISPFCEIGLLDNPEFCTPCIRNTQCPAPDPNPPVINVDEGYIQLDSRRGGPPPSIHCADSSHDGRMVVDSANDLLYICTQSGWIAK